MLAVGNEVSGTTTIFSINTIVAPVTTEIQVLGINDFHGRLEVNARTRRPALPCSLEPSRS
jgi:2',3'-cyclic-nucleotide 2'-phosphodiesterase (5'-nucleotidase family)